MAFRPPLSARSLVANIAAALICVALAVAWTFPLVSHLKTAIPGDGAGDNVAALWNFWWMRFALQHDLPFFTTRYLFAPVGTSLALHTHLALPAWLGASALRSVPLVLAHNFLLLGTLAANGFACYALIRRLTPDWPGAVCGAIIFAGSPFIAGHLQGHFNLLSAWTLPLVCLAAIQSAQGSLRWAVILGVLLGLTPYLDYYYALYGVALTVALVWLDSHDIAVVRVINPQLRRWRHWVGVVLGLDVVIVAIIVLTGASSLAIGPIRMRTSLFNPLQALWALLALWLWLGTPVRLKSVSMAGTRWSWPRLGVSAGLALVIAAPLWLGVAKLALTGNYTSQPLMWRSGPQGVDVATLLIGNPHSVWMGGLARRVNSYSSIDSIERSAWFGLVPLFLTLVIWRRPISPDVRRWTILGGLALLWSLGPHLTFLGYNTGMILPEAILRYVPVVSNARIPGRALVVVYLALGVLAAQGLARLRETGMHRAGSLLLIVCCVIDFAPAPFPLVSLDRPHLYARLSAESAPGAVLEIPLGWREGFGEHGRLDSRVLWYQTIHERPLTGGFVARLAPSVEHAYDADALLTALVNASEPGATSAVTLPTAIQAQESLRRLDISFVVLNSETSPEALAAAVREWGLVPIATDGARELFGVPTGH